MSLDLVILENEITRSYLNHEYILMSDDLHFTILMIAEEKKLKIFSRMNDSYEDYEIKKEELDDWLLEIESLQRYFSDNSFFDKLIKSVKESDGTVLDESILKQETFVLFFNKLKALILKAKKVNKPIWAIAD